MEGSSGGANDLAGLKKGLSHGVPLGFSLGKPSAGVNSVPRPTVNMGMNNEMGDIGGHEDVHGDVHGNKDNSIPSMKSYAAAVQTEKMERPVLFRSLRNDQLVEGSDVVLPISSVKEVSYKFVNTLYGYFIGKRLAYPIVEQFAKNAWNKYGFVRSMMNGKGFFFFQFDSKIGLDRVLEDGPWLIRNVPIIMNIWTPSVSMNKEGVKVVPVWVKMHDVPLVAFTDDGLSLLATQIGNPKRLDGHTSNMCRDLWGRTSYARALIEVSSDKELKEEINVAIPVTDGVGFTKEVIKIEYEWKPPRCGTCCIFGHTDATCSRNVGVKPTEPKAVEAGTDGEVKEVKGKQKAYQVVQQYKRKLAGGQKHKVNPSVIYKPVSNPSELLFYRKRINKGKGPMGGHDRNKQDSRANNDAGQNSFGIFNTGEFNEEGLETIDLEQRPVANSEGASTPGVDGLNG